MVLRQGPPEHRVLDPGEGAVADPLPPWHAALEGRVLEEARAEHHLRLTPDDRLDHLAHQGRLVLVVGVHHHDGVRPVADAAHVAGLLVGAVAPVRGMGDHLEPLLQRDGDGLIATGVVDDERAVGRLDVDRGGNRGQRRLGVVRGQHGVHVGLAGARPEQRPRRAEHLHPVTIGSYCRSLAGRAVSVLLLLQLLLQVLCCLHIGLARLKIEFAALSVEDAQCAIGRTEYLFSGTHHSRQTKPASDNSRV